MVISYKQKLWILWKVYETNSWKELVERLACVLIMTGNRWFWGEMCKCESTLYWYSGVIVFFSDAEKLLVYHVKIVCEERWKIDFKKILFLFGALPTCPFEILWSILFGSNRRFITGNRSVMSGIHDIVLLLVKMVLKYILCS